MEFNSQPKVLLSIVTWNHHDSIEHTIRSIFRQSYPNIQLVVFDNNSSDNTPAVLKKFNENQQITFIFNKENIGFCGGHNYVISHFVNYDIIILVNPDLILDDGCVGEIIEGFSIDNKIGAVCSLLLQSDGETPLIDSMGMRLTRSRRYELINHGLPLRALKLKSGYIAGLDGALPAFKKQAVESLLIDGDFFNQLFFSHKEDWDISWRMSLFGWKTYFNPNAIALHPRGFKPNNLKARAKMNSTIKYDAFKNQFLLLLINEDFSNFLRDIFAIVPKLFLASVYCIFYERASLRAYPFVIRNWPKIMSIRRDVQNRRKLSSAEFRNEFIYGKSN
jgi:GT2 family glycosyltransferase